MALQVQAIRWSHGPANWHWSAWGSMNKKKSELTRQHALALSIFGMLLAVASAVAGVLAWEYGEELDRASLGAFTPDGILYGCFATCGAPPLVILGVLLVIRAARTAPRPPDPPTPF